ncbi:Trp biosynthesis-associated membrane protein [Nesterenkonia ebinurensis]|uniref:Trp biosynthesis-associated membrane protein n=1 Tax=Nesterenkonia ebinurensis TaxID=2608252 RepID=UPI00123DE0E6|nr:Trp biosynthesis-associated membrane protein [Nesterenkonia ebinurensis]
MGYLAYFFQRRNTILVVQLGAILLLVSTALTWVRVTGLPETATTSSVSLVGAEMSPALGTMGLVGVAGGVAASIARRWVRGLIAAVLLGAGVMALFGTFGAIISPADAAASALAEHTGTTERAGQYSVGWAVWMGLAGSGLLSLGSLAMLLFSPGWSDEKTTKKYSRGEAQAENPDEIDMWDDLSDGDDPTDKK